MKRLLTHQNGFTLLEVLLSITILSIIFISFLTLFPQAAKFNDTNNNKLTGVSLAKEVLATLQNSSAIDKFLLNIKQNPNSDATYSKSNTDYQTLGLTENIINETDHYQLIMTRNENKVIVKIYKTPDFSGSHVLYKTEVIIEMIEGSKTTNLFGYLTH